MLDPILLVELAALGSITGFLAGLLGIGGGMLLVPCITFVLSQRGISADLSIKMAIATSMATILFTSLSSIRAHHRQGTVRWDWVWHLTPGILIGSMLAGAGIFRLLSGQWLALLFAFFISFTATQMLRSSARPSPATPNPRCQPRLVKRLAAGGVIGLASGLVGAGGGFLSVPLMTWCGVAMHHAVATSAALGFPISLANAAGYLWSGANAPGRPAGSLGYVFVPALAVIASFSVLTAPLGARMAHALPVVTLKRLFAFLLYVVAAAMAWKAWQS